MEAIQSVTLTVTEERASSYSMTLRSPSHETHLSKISNLLEILIKHKDNTDPHSLNLFEQSKVLINFIRQESNSQPNLERISAQFEKFKKNLVNPFGCSLLEEPVLYQDIIWEKSDLEKYRSYSSFFSTDAIEGVPHEFTQEVLKWITAIERSYPFLQNERSEDRVVTLTGSQGARNRITTLTEIKKKEQLVLVHAWQELEKYNKIIDLIHKERANSRLIKILQEKNRIAELAIQQRDEERNQDLIRLDHSLRRQAEDLHQKLGNIRSNYEESTQILRNELQDARDKIHETQNLLVQEQAENASNKQKINYLYSQLSYLHSQVNWLQQEVNNSDSGCIIS